METLKTTQEQIQHHQEWIRVINLQIEGWWKELDRINGEISKLSEERGRHHATIADLEESLGQ
jgi:hypothetical protein